MTILSRIFYALRSASLLVVVITLAFSVPMSSHASMMDHDPSHLNVDHSMHDMSSHDAKYPDGHDNHTSLDCCSGICVVASIGFECSFSSLKQVDNHEAEAFLTLTSMGSSRLMRPPSL